MTYKKIVEELIRAKANKWVEKLLEENGIDYRFTNSEVIEMENDKDRDTIYWQVRVEIIRNSYFSDWLVVGGTADDLAGICSSVIWDRNHNIVWMSVEETRKQLGIEKFKIA